MFKYHFMVHSIYLGDSGITHKSDMIIVYYAGDMLALKV